MATSDRRAVIETGGSLPPTTDLRQPNTTKKG